ncbi:MAG: hypothetical protein ACYC61_28410, partial [Isosphaeraceae bacterium]
WYGSTLTINVGLSDGQVHDVGIYAVDWPNQGRSERVQILDAATGSVLDTETLSSFTGGEYLQWAVSGNVVIQATSLSGPNAVISGVFIDAPSLATFVKSDTTTQGAWIGKYGTQGYSIAGVATSLPSYATVAPAGGTPVWTWSSSTTDPRALASPGGGTAAAKTWYGSTLTINVGLSDGQVHDVGIYAVDWPNQGRSERVQILDAATGTVLDTETLSSFTGGEYLQWAVSGNVVIQATSLSGPNAVISGVFIG